MYSQKNGIYFSHTGVLSSSLPLPETAPMSDIGTTRNRESSASSSSGDRPIDWDSKGDLPSDLSAAPATFKKDHDVFLSFWGEDTRFSFTSHLLTALTNAGFSTYFDEERLERGEAIRPGLMEAIERSKISIIVFSKNYAGSTWCLDELTRIIECRRTLGLIVLPIFYGIDPWDVRKQSGSCGNAFEKLARSGSDTDNVRRWRLALTDAGGLNGWHARLWGKEAELVKNIVRDVSRKLSGATDLHVARYPVGIDSRVQKLKKDYDVFVSLSNKAHLNRALYDHLYNALTDAGFSTCMYLSAELEKGEDIRMGHRKIIEGSKISIVIFSPGYADYIECLEELTKISECRRTLGQMVLPIFYHVQATEVRKQSGLFADVFTKYEVEHADKVQQWRLALKDTANLSGWDAKNWRNETDLIKDIVRDVSRKLLGAANFSISPYSVGIDSRVHELTSLLKVELDDDVCVIGICAMGGMGKTTIAKAIYNMFNIQFGSNRSFLENVRQIWDQPDCRVGLQNQLLKDILKSDKENVGSVDKGIKMIEKLLRRKRVLVIVDDVDHIDQVHATAGSRDWFGPGSRIIITTRNEQLLKRLNVDATYMVPEMNDVESLKLFSLHAFGDEEPIKEYLEHSRTVVNYCGGLPLALKVLGTFLSREPISIWKSAIDKLRMTPNGEVQEKLKLSFDTLGDDMVKDIFLDISCFFIGMDRHYVQEILDGCGLHAEVGLKLLIERCLITVSERNKLMMHDLLRDMGRAIVREQFIKEPGKRSRLWLHKDVCGVLTDETGTGKIEGLSLELERLKKASFTAKAFVEMKRLRLLQLNYVELTGSFEYLSKNLRWLCWKGFPLESIPSNFCQGKLVAINLKYSKLRQVWKDPQLLDKLKVLNLSHSSYLIETPDFSYLPSLGKLILKDCKSLYKVHHSIGDLENLVLVNLKDCKILKELPQKFYRLKSLETLILSGCSSFDNFAEDIGEMASLRTLLADNTAIREVPHTIGRLTSLQHLSLCGLRVSPLNCSSPLGYWSSLIMPKLESKYVNLLPPSLCGLKSLTTLSLSNCKLTDNELPKDLGCLSSLVTLRLDNNDFHELPASLKGLTRLRSLSLDNCTMLQSILDLPTNLKSLYAANCEALERMPDMSEMSNLIILELANCRELVHIPGLDKLLEFLSLQLQSKNNITTTSCESFLQESTGPEFGGHIFHVHDIPKQFNYNAKGSTIRFDVPLLVDCSLKGCRVSAVYSYTSKLALFSAFPIISVVNKTQRRNFTFDLVALSHHVRACEGHLWRGLISCDGLNLNGGDKVEVCINFGEYYNVEKISVFLLLEDHANHEMIQHDSVANVEYHGSTMLPIPMEDVTTVTETVDCILPWPIHHVSSGQQQPMGYEHLPSVNMIHQYVNSQMTNETLMMILLPKGVFGQQRKILIDKQEMIEFVSMQKIGAITLGLFIGLIYEGIQLDPELTTNYTFVDPEFTSTMAGSPEQRSEYLTNRISGVKKNKVAILPYNSGDHWMLAVVDVHSSVVYWLDPLGHPMPQDFKTLLNHAMQQISFRILGKRKRHCELEENCIKCPRQTNGIQCGYFVMRFIKELVMARVTIPPTNFFQNKTTYRQQEIDEVSEELALYIQNRWTSFDGLRT